MDTLTNMTPGARVRDLRWDRRWTQRELARRSGVHPVVISQVELGVRNLSGTTLLRIARTLEVDPFYLLGEKVA